MSEEDEIGKDLEAKIELGISKEISFNFALRTMRTSIREYYNDYLGMLEDYNHLIELLTDDDLVVKFYIDLQGNLEYKSYPKNKMGFL